jgi:hypothetical protein
MFKSKTTDPDELEQVVRDHIANAMEVFTGYLKELADHEQLSEEKS